LSRWALDTNALSEAARRRPHKGLQRFLERHGPACAIPAPVWHELWYGCVRLPAGEHRAVLLEWLSDVRQSMEILPYDGEAATWHASERARLIARGRTPDLTDGAIASVACTRGLTLVTANVADFAVFEGLEVLDWRTNKRVPR